MAAHAQLRVDIAGVGNKQIPVAVAAFADEAAGPNQVSAIIRADLERSGVFKVIDVQQTIADTANVDLAAFKAGGADALVVGSVQKLADGRFQVRYKLLDAVKQTQLSQLNDAAAPQNLRLEAHRIADDVYEKLTGVRGVFATRIAYVKVNPAPGPHKYELMVADADGENEQLAAGGRESIVSPVWSPDGSRLAYVAIDMNKPVVHVHDLRTGRSAVVANFKGNNSAPAWSPDGTKLAVSLSTTGNTQIYVMNADGSGVRRVSNSKAIDTEAQFSGDGQSLYFLSDRSGGPQIYRMSVNGGQPARVTFNGNFNISPRISPDGTTLAWIARVDGNYCLYAMDLASGQEQRLAEGATEPSFAPNGKYIVYAGEADGRGALAVVSVDGRVKHSLTARTAAIKAPGWGPFRK
ncbi:Dipeptidyl-peptidase 5 [Massilia sp. Bi118]|uniref:Tol-Pal system beta propeller repeat protein TolB n=1 Tax=Massilia sp. Bi118 TaxID=2822346 RepID=UPI001D709F13|nr:Tol-Pal system beta propeller repeat protein TolB [Massilia sp. Bi118]CAH0187106.1 Dipeptidyl-peptidase 5 [Massilia sp. Bi118]